MKTKNLLRFTAIGLLALLPGLALMQTSLAADDPASAADVKQETVELLQSLKSYGAGQRDEALEKSRAALDNIDRRIEALESEMFERWDEMDQTAREQARESLQALREQRTRVAEWYGSMKSGTASAWDEVKHGFSRAYEALHDAWEQSEQDIHSGDKR
jgi:hypothetical protein